MNRMFLGPFGPVVGYGLALANTAFLLRTLATGRIKLWNAPKDTAPEAIVRVVSVLNIVLIVALWLWAAPANRLLILAIGVICALALLVFFLTYRQLLLSWTVRDAHGKEFLGGTKLTPRARELFNEGKSVQEIFKGAQYYPELVWTPGSLALSRTILTFLLVSFMTSATIAVTSAGFATQVTLTNQPAAAVIWVADAPGSDAGKAPIQSPE